MHPSPCTLYRFSIVFIVILLFSACSKNKPSLDQNDFMALLIDLHVVDGMFSTNGSSVPNKDKNVYKYYNWIYDKYGITNVEFDSCVKYYSANPQLYIEIYDKVIDSLNKALTVQNQLLSQLKVNDSINYFPTKDTIIFNKEHIFHTFEMDSLLPGLYNFTTTFKFDSVDIGRNTGIEAMFISQDHTDTLRIRKIYFARDTVLHNYIWSQYIDSSYNKLIITLGKVDNPAVIKQRKAKAWNTTLYKPYITKKREAQLAYSLKNTRKSKK